MENYCYDLKDIASLTRLSDRMLRRMMQRGILFGTRVSGKWMFSWNDIDKFISSPEAKEYLYLRRKNDFSDWLHSLEGVADKSLFAFTYSENGINIANLMDILIKHSKISSICLHYRRLNGVLHIAYYGDKAVVDEAIRELYEKCSLN